MQRLKKSSELAPTNCRARMNNFRYKYSKCFANGNDLFQETDMNHLQNWLENEVYPHIFQYADKIFPKHNFVKNGNVWNSNTYMDGTLHKRKDKVWISAEAPYCINEQGGDNLSFYNYFKKYNNLSDAEVIEFFKSITNTSVPAAFSNLKYNSNNTASRKVIYEYVSENTKLYRYFDYALEERLCIMQYDGGLKDYEASNLILKDNPDAKLERVYRVAVNQKVINKNVNPDTMQKYSNYYQLNSFWENHYLSIEELKQELKKGHPIVLAHMKTNKKCEYIHRNSDNFDFAELFALDIDESMTIKDALQMDLTQKALFIYTSYNHTNINQRFRIIFELPVLIDNKDVYKKIISDFINIYDADPKAKDACRCFYGNTNAIFLNNMDAKDE